MKVTIILEKQSGRPGYYKAYLCGSGNDRGPNLLTGERKTTNIDQAKAHATTRMKEVGRGAFDLAEIEWRTPEA
jgi:hypothetical protein